MAQRLIECAVDAKQQRGRQRPGQYIQIAFDFLLHLGGHICPAQQGVGHHQHGHAQCAGQQAQIHGLAQGVADGLWLASATLLGPQRQQGLKNTHQRGIDADEDGRAHGERSHGILRIAAGHDGVGSAKGHDR